MGVGLNPIDLGVVIGVMVLVTYLGHQLSGTITSRSSFFKVMANCPGGRFLLPF